MGIMKRSARAGTVAATVVGVLALAACSTAIKGYTPAASDATAGPSAGVVVTVGFVGAGTSDAWNAADAASIQGAFTDDAGFELEYANSASVDHDSQVDAFNALVDQNVDVILLSVVDGSDWTDALTRAKTAAVPVILIGRAIDPDTESLYTTRITPGDADAAKAAAAWALAAIPAGTKYFVLEGASGIGSADLRTEGWDSVMSTHPEFEKIGAASGGASREGGQSATAAALSANANAVPLIFAQDDQMALGAVDAVVAAGLTPGTDVKIATIGASKETLEALLAGKLSFVIEYTPLLGPTAADVVRTITAESTVDSIVVVPGATFTTITQEQIDAREY